MQRTVGYVIEKVKYLRVIKIEDSWYLIRSFIQIFVSSYNAIYIIVYIRKMGRT